jgi:hypothetical protein
LSISPAERILALGWPNRVLLFVVHNHFVNCRIFLFVLILEIGALNVVDYTQTGLGLHHLVSTGMPQLTVKAAMKAAQPLLLRVPR